jgi:hypothetical protein
LSPFRLQTMLVVGVIGAALILVHLLGTGGNIAGFALMALATVLTASSAPQRGSDGVNWWRLLLVGTLMALVGVPLALGLETVGGLLAAAGGAVFVVGAVLGFP